eukprot:COSAG01_NODE_3816_length_5670_cov_8.691079_2_plen_197_part_00
MQGSHSRHANPTSWWGLGSAARDPQQQEISCSRQARRLCDPFRSEFRRLSTVSCTVVGVPELYSCMTVRTKHGKPQQKSTAAAAAAQLSGFCSAAASGEVWPCPQNLLQNRGSTNEQNAGSLPRHVSAGIGSSPASTPRVPALGSSLVTFEGRQRGGQKLTFGWANRHPLAQLTGDGGIGCARELPGKRQSLCHLP